MNRSKNSILQSGKASFKIEVPYQLIDSGPATDSKPLIVYLHGFNQTMKSFQLDCEHLLAVHAYHLFIEAPYPVFSRKRNVPVSEWGRAWYLYDGDQEQFIRSLGQASRFINEIIERTISAVNPTRTALLGYSMGGYLAGYHAITNPEQIQELIICGARYKSELLEGSYDKINHQNILALHGNADKSVESAPQKKEIEGLKQKGIDATFVALDETHAFTRSFEDEILDWLNGKGYNFD